MNYFSHFYLLPNQDDNYLSLGSIFPDLIRDSKINPKQLKEEIKATRKPEFIQLGLGIEYHINQDLLFHNSEFFKVNVREFSKQLRLDQNISLQKYTYFFAHIFIEIYLDHYLILQYPKKLDHFYENLEQIDLTIIFPFFLDYLPNNDFELFEHRFSQFLDKRFLYNYQTIDQIINATSYVFEKVCKIAIPKSEHVYYKNLIQTIFIPIFDKNARNLFIQLKTDL